MNKPNRLVTFLYGLIGIGYAYDTADEVREAIADNCFTTLADRARNHSDGADRLTDSLAFQPGLLDLHDELHDTWHYLTALKARARDLGYDTLTEHLDAAADSTRDVLQAVATAAENTIPSPAIPANR